MQTVQFVFDMAIHLMDAQNESTGATETTDTHEYALRTPNLLNTLLDKVYPYSDTYPAVSNETNAERPYLESVTSLEDFLDLDSYICRKRPEPSSASIPVTSFCCWETRGGDWRCCISVI